MALDRGPRLDGFQEPCRQLFDSADARPYGQSALTKSCAFERSKRVCVAREDMNRHVPLSILAADGGRRLVVADNKDKRIGRGTVGKKTAYHLKIVNHRTQIGGVTVTAHRVAETARRIDMPRSNLYKKIEKYELVREG